MHLTYKLQITIAVMISLIILCIIIISVMKSNFTMVNFPKNKLIKTGDVCPSGTNELVIRDYSIIDNPMTFVDTIKRVFNIFPTNSNITVCYPVETNQSNLINTINRASVDCLIDIPDKLQANEFCTSLNTKLGGEWVPDIFNKVCTSNKTRICENIINELQVGDKVADTDNIITQEMLDEIRLNSNTTSPLNMRLLVNEDVVTNFGEQYDKYFIKNTGLLNFNGEYGDLLFKDEFGNFSNDLVEVNKLLSKSLNSRMVADYDTAIINIINKPPTQIKIEKKHKSNTTNIAIGVGVSVGVIVIVIITLVLLKRKNLYNRTRDGSRVNSSE